MSNVTASTRVGDRVVSTLKVLVRTRITTGLITVLPIVVTVWLLRIVFRITRDASLWLFDAFVLSEWGRTLLESWGVRPADVTQKGLTAYPVHIQWTIWVLAVFLTLFVLYIIGLVTAHVLGRRALSSVEELMERLPFVKTLYRSSKQIIGSFGGEQKKGFQSVALIPFPDEKMRAVGFITSKFKDSGSGEELVTVFIPSTPNPTTGFLEVLRQKDVVELDWSVEQAVTTIMSGGMIRPEFLSIERLEKTPAGPR